MKASSLVKKTTSIETVFKWIENANENGNFRYRIPPDLCIDDSVKLELIENGFRVYVSDSPMWYGSLTIEW